MDATLGKSLAESGLADIEVSAWCLAPRVLVYFFPCKELAGRQTRLLAVADALSSVPGVLPGGVELLKPDFSQPEDEPEFKEGYVRPQVVADFLANGERLHHDFSISVKALPRCCEETEDEKELDRLLDEDDSAKVEPDDGNEDVELIPIPPPPVKKCDEVFLVLAYEYYDAIEKGDKTTEFRDYNEYYVRKLLSQPIQRVRFQRGYGGPGHPKPRQMTWTVKNIDLYNYETRESADPHEVPEGFVPTFIAIDLGERIR